MTFDIGLNEVCVRVGARYVITKFSGMDSLPNFLTHGAPLRARFARAGAPLWTAEMKWKWNDCRSERNSILLCRLHTDRFPQSVVIFGGRLWRERIAWVRGPTLAALRELRQVLHYISQNTVLLGFSYRLISVFSLFCSPEFSMYERSWVAR